MTVVLTLGTCVCQARVEHLEYLVWCSHYPLRYTCHRVHCTVEETETPRVDLNSGLTDGTIHILTPSPHDNQHLAELIDGINRQRRYKENDED